MDGNAALLTRKRPDLVELTRRVAMGEVKIKSLSPDQRLEIEDYIATFDLDEVERKAEDGKRASWEEFHASFAESKFRVFDAYAAQAVCMAAAPEPYVQTTPSILYRCVSIQELEDILARGHLGGERNAWNYSDHRRMVLFLDRDDNRLRSQGDDPQRYIKRQLFDHPLAIRCRELHVKHRGEDGGLCSPDDYRGSEELDEANKAFEELIRPLAQAEARRLQNAPWDCAVIRTVPLAGATVWHKDHRHNRMNRTEYGFPGGAVQATHIAEVTLLKDRQPVLSGSLDDIELAVAQARRTEEDHGTSHSPSRGTEAPSFRAGARFAS